MILVDANVWIDHFSRPDPSLNHILSESLAMIHPAVIGEVALGSLSRRAEILALLADQASPECATDAEVLALIETQQLYGRCIGFVDVHLLASLLLTPGAMLWTGDKRLVAAAQACGIPVFRP